MARSVGDRRTRPRPARVGIRHLRHYLPPPAALCGRVRHALPGGPDCAQPHDHGVVPGVARHAATARDERGRALLCRPSDDVRRALARSAYRPERRPGWCYLGDPRTANTSPPGLARYSSLRSWLSQWSYDLSNAKGPKNAARIRHTPVLQVENQADDAVPASHNPTIRAALATPDKEYVRIEGATQYYQNQPTQLQYWIGAAA